MESSPAMDGGSPEIAFFDVETTIPAKRGEGYALLEFGAIVVCPRRLAEVESFTTLVRPADPNAISAASVRCNGITGEAIASAPAFGDVADRVFNILHGRVWAGHNIVRFDCARIREAFAEIGRAPPEPKGMIDTLPLLTQRFGRRAGNMKMASLATYFGLGQQKHRSLDDVRMNLEVLKYCATVLLLETSLPDVFSTNVLVSQSVINRDQGEEPKGGRPNTDPSTLMTHIEQMKIDTVQTDATMFRRSAPNSHEIFCTTIPIPSSEGSSGFAGFLEPDEVSTDNISAPVVPFHQGGQRILLLHRDLPLQLCCMGLRVHFGLSTKFVDHAGRPKLSFVVDAPESLCRVLDVCDHVAQRSVQNSGSSSEWRTLVMKNGYSNSSTVRLHVRYANDDVAVYSTEIYQKEPAGNTQKLVFSKIDPAGLDLLFVPGTTVDAYFSIDPYDYQQNAGLRLVAKKLVFHTK